MGGPPNIDLSKSPVIRVLSNRQAHGAFLYRPDGIGCTLAGPDFRKIATLGRPDYASPSVSQDGVLSRHSAQLSILWLLKGRVLLWDPG